ncbi:MAG: hypothetical protein ABI396_14340 [Ktedonobacteraceae bacterium]
MEPEHYNKALTAETGRRGGLERAARQSTDERRALARYAARVRWHPRKLRRSEKRPRKPSR